MNTWNSSRSRYLSAAVSAALSFAAADAQAGPQNGNVTQGAATISTPAGNITQIDQTTNSVSIDWQSFDVAANESVNFNQPSASSVALNRILTQDPSQILGSINANGRIFLLNPNGIIFGASARVNVGSLVASSLDLTDADATTGRYSFATAAERSGAIVNDGVITAANGGSITLLGGSVLNDGLILADYGTVNLGAGRAATLSFDGDGLMRFQIDSGLLTDTNGVNAAVNNSGEIAAAGGQVLLTAQQAGDVVARAVNNDGVIRASRVENTGGVIRLVGGGGTVVNGGTLDATGSNGAGGEIAVLGENVALTGAAVVDVSGTHGGGTGFVGGGFAGADPALLNAQNTTVDAGAVIRADSTQSGDAGRVAVWSEGRTTFNGDILARASGTSGNGGFAEVSGRQNLRIGGHATLTSENGAAGSLLLDPGLITIVNGGNTAPVADNEVNDGWMNAQLGTPGTLTISTAVYGDGSPATLTVDSAADVVWNAASTLELVADSSILFENGSVVRSNDGDGSLVVRSGADVVFAGTLDLAGNLTVEAQDAISQSSALIVAGDASFTTLNDTGAAITLTNAGNEFGSIGASIRNAGDTAGATADISIVENDGTQLSGNLRTAAGQTVTISSGGAITQSAVALTASGNVSLTAGSGQSITLESANAVTGRIGFDAATVSFNNAGNTALRTSTVTNGLTVESAGSITQTGALSVTGNSSFTAGAGQSITLGQANTFNGNVTLNSSSGNLNNVTVRDTTALTLQTLAISGDLTATAASIAAQALTTGGNLNLTATTGNITQTAAMNVAGNSTFTADAGQSILLGQANTFTGTVAFVGAGGSLEDLTVRDTTALDLQALALAGDLDVTATSGAITQSGALDIGGTATFTAATGQSISLVDPANDFTGAVTFVGSGGNLMNVSVRDASALTLAGLTLSGNLGVNAASIAQSGALIVGGDSAFTASGSQSIDLDNSGNTFTGAVSFAPRSGTLQNISIADTTALDLQALTINGDLTASATSLTQSGALSVGGTATLTSAAGMALNSTQAGALTVNVTTGDVTQSGDLDIAGATTLNADGRNVTLTSSGNVFGGDIAITADTAALTNSAATTLSTSTVGSSLTVTSTGAINQTGALTVTGGSTTLNSSAAVALNSIDTGTLAIGAGGTVTQSAGTLNVTGNSVINAATQTVTLNAANMFGGSIAVTAANASLTNGGATTLGASAIANDLTVVSAGALSQSAPVSVGGDATLTGAGVTFDSFSAGTLAVNSSAAIGQTGVLDVTGVSNFNAAGQNVTLTAGNTLGGGIALTAATASLNNSAPTILQASTLTGDLTVTSTGAITQSGALTVSGNTTVAAAGQNVALDDTANQFGGGVAVTAANVTLVDADSIDLRASTVNGDLDVTAAAGTITQSGALSVTGSSTFTAADGQSILLTDATNVFGGVRLASSGQLDNVSLAAASSLDLQGLDIAGDLVVTTGGSLTQSGALVVAGNADFRTLNAGNNIALENANQFGSVTATGAGDVAIAQGTGDLNLRQVTAAGAARLAATSGSIVDDAADPSAASVSAASVELVALDNIGTVTDLLTRQGTAIAVNTNGGSLAAHVAGTNGQINLSLPGGSAPVAAAGAISAGGSGRLLIQSTGDLSLNAFNSAIVGFDEIGFSADGTLNVPGAQSDLIAGPLAALYLRGGLDIARADRTFNLSASHLIFDSASQGGDVTLNIDADRIDASVGSGASLTVQDAGDLTLGTVNAGNNVTIRAASIRDDGDVGSVTRVSAGGTVSFDASAGIGEADGAGDGRIDTAANAVLVNASTGSVYLSHAGDLQISGDAAAGAIDVIAPTGNVAVTSTLRANGPLSIVAGTAGAVTGNITLTGTARSTGAATLTAANGGTISDANDAAAHLVAQSATLSAAAVGSQANALGVEVGALSASVGGELYVNAANAIQLRTIDAATIAISATGAIDDDGDNSTRLTAQSVSLSGTSVGSAGVGGEIDTTTDRLSASASAGGLYVGESGDLQLAALGASGTGNSIVIRAEGAITDDGDTTTRVSGGSLSLTGTSIGAAESAIDTQVTLLNATASAGGVFVNEVDDLQINTVTGTDVVLTTAGALTDDGNDSTRVIGTNIRLNAARIGTSENRMDTAAGSLDVTATAGGIYFAEQDDVALGEVRSSGTGNTVDGRTGGNGNMTVQTLVTQGGAVNLTAGGTGSITVTGAIESNNGVVNLTSGNALALPGLDTGTGSVVLRTVNDLNVGTINASSVSITSDTGNVSLGTINATGGTVTVSANNGTITDGDETSLTARDATLNARAIGGPDQALNLAVDNLSAAASAGGIYVNDIGGLTLNAINATGAVSIVTTGALSQAAGIASGGHDIDIFAESILMQAGATTLSGNGNISYVANAGAASLEVLDAGTGRTLVIAADSVYSTLNPASGINNVSGSAVEIRAGGLFGGAGEIGTLSNPITIATSNSADRSVFLIVPAVNGIQTTTPSINYSGSSATLLLKGYTGSTGVLLFDLSSTFSPETILSGGETIVPLLNGRVAVNSDSLSAAKQALSSGVITRVNVDWAAFDPNVSLFGTLDPSLRLPADQVDEEVPTASLIPEGTVLSMTRDGWELKRDM